MRYGNGVPFSVRKRAVAVVNKCDLPARLDESRLDGFAAVCRVSALRGTGLGALGAAVAAAFPLPEAAPGEILTNARQAEAAGRALESLEAAREALEQAVTLSETGAKDIRRAIEGGTFTAEALAVPYANLANMHQQLGHSEQALRFGEMAKRSTPATSTAGKEATQSAPVKR